jgi:quercetin dioxygenase-like cupin family protein
MRRTSARKWFAGAVLVSAALGTNLAIAQDAAKVAPEIVRVVFENERARGLEVISKAGAKIPMHSHAQHVLVALSPCKFRSTSPDGKVSEVELKAGEVRWGDATTHAVENISGAECRLVDVELKK